MEIRRKPVSCVAALLAAIAMAVGWVVAGPSVVLAQASPGESALTITPNPTYQGREFQGWGTSLVWFANATGNYPEPLRGDLYQKVFSSDGMNLNIARYNVGGGNASDVPDYLRYGAAVEGWWASNEDPELGPLSTYAQRNEFLEQWDPAVDSSFNWHADQSQRWWVEQLAEDRDDMVWEAFSNSPPYFMTNSGFVTGSFNRTDEQVATIHDAPMKFAEYLAAVVAHMEQTYGIDFTSVDPFNEPCAGYWGTTIVQGEQWPRKGGTVQEGAQICPGSGEGQQQSIIAKLSQALTRRGVDARVSANDETNPGNFNRAWGQYDAQTRSLVGQINVHTYGTGGIQQARDIAKANDLPLWMSEVGGDFLEKRDEAGAIIREFDPVHFSAATGFAQKVISDLRQLEPDNYVFWQEIEDYYNMEKVERLNWGSVFVDFDCNDSEETRGYSTRRLEDAGWVSGDILPENAKCKIVTNSKYNAMRNFTHYITPGSHLIAVDDQNTAAAITPEGLRLVHVNPSGVPQDVTVDLSNFGIFTDEATVTPIVTTQASSEEDLEGNALVEGASTPVRDKKATVSVPGMSVTTLVVEGVSGIAEDAELIQDGQAYVVNGKKSGKPLTATEKSVIIDDYATTAHDAAAQLWRFYRLEDSPYTNAQRYVIKNVDGRFLGADSQGVYMRDTDEAAAAADPEMVWILNTTDGVSISLLNVAMEQVLDVNGESNQSGTGVGTWASTGGTHQQWNLYQPKLQGILPTHLATSIGDTPDLPATVVPIYEWGNGEPIPVVWNLDSVSWDSPGTIVIQGSGEDLFGNRFDNAVLNVDVGPLDFTDPASCTIATNTSRERVADSAPQTVTARMKNSSATHTLPVTWDFSTLPSVIDQVGYYTVNGTVAEEDNHGRALEAHLTVLATEPIKRNVLLDDGVQASASFSQTEYENYDPANTHNGNREDKAWSTWGSNRQYASDYLEYELPAATTVSSAKVFFYRDGTNKSWADAVRAEYWDGESWVLADTVHVESDKDPLIVEVNYRSVTTERVRIHMDATNYLTVSEVELYSLDAAPGSLADAGVIYVNNAPIDGFTPSQVQYQVGILGSVTPQITVVPLDSAATSQIEWDGDSARIEIVAADGQTRKEYHLTFRRQVDVLSVAIQGEPVVGATLHASAVSDPGDAKPAFQWLRDDEEIHGATSADYVVSPSDQGHFISVRVVASFEGYVQSDPTFSHPDGGGLEIGSELSADNTLASLIVGAQAVEGFSPDITEYHVVVSGSRWPVVTAIPSDPRAQVDYEFDETTGIAIVTVTAENGQSRVYRLHIHREVAIVSLNIEGDPALGSVTKAQVITDPKEATVSYQWYVDGLPVSEGTAQSLEMVSDYVGKKLKVQVTATYDGFLTGTGESQTITVGDTPGSADGASAGSKQTMSTTLSKTGTDVGALIIVVTLLAVFGIGVFGLSMRRQSR